MTHDGRMARGEANHRAGILLDNNDTLYFLANNNTKTPTNKTKTPTPKKEKEKEKMEEEE